MLTENNIKPSNNFEVMNIDKNKCDIYFYNDIQEIEKDTGNEEKETAYKYNLYVLKDANYRPDIEKDIAENYDKWLNRAIYYEKHNTEEAKNEREWRNSELDETDRWLTLSDYPGRPAEYTDAEIEKYRKALRNYPQDADFPYGTRPKLSH